MSEKECIFHLNRLRLMCSKDHLDTEAEALTMSIKAMQKQYEETAKITPPIVEPNRLQS